MDGSARRRLARRIVAPVALATLVSACGLSNADLMGTRIPEVAYDAYRSAAAQAPDIADGCQVDWQILAGIGRVESNHGRVDGPRQLDAAGDVSPPIRGPALDGEGGRQAIPDTDGGELDGDATWDRAMGPLQFIPDTWRELGRDGNGDGVADPDNLYDAALTAAAHLCLREPGTYTDRAALRAALVRYNASGAYADAVLEWVDRYRATGLDALIIRSASPGPSAADVAPGG
jgi:membrane-bound lytic murein transglycosylase B